MGEWVNYWFVAFILALLLSLACAGGLVACWSLTPETSKEDWEITSGGRILLRARLLFAIVCGVVFACLFVLIYFLDAPFNSQPFLWCDAHRQSLPLLLIVSSGLSALGCALALNGRGEGRRALTIGTIVIFLLSFSTAILLLRY